MLRCIEAFSLYLCSITIVVCSRTAPDAAAPLPTLGVAFRFMVEKNAADNPFNLYEFIPTDEAFAKKVNCTVEEYQRFRDRLVAANGGAPQQLSAGGGASRRKLLRAR